MVIYRRVPARQKGEREMTSMHPLHCIMPPHMLEQIAENGTPRQRQWALRTLATTEQLRGQRHIAGQVRAIAAAVRAVQRERITYDAENGTALPGRVARNENDPPTGDPAVDEAHDGAGATWELYQQVYGRESIDGHGMRLESTVHFDQGYDNAFWDGKQMVYGDGDQDLPEPERLFNRFTAAIDIIGHELTHGVTQYEARLVYWDQPGALNESFSDVFGSLVKQRALGQSAAQADWLVGHGLFTANVNGQGIRSMAAPGTHPEPRLLPHGPRAGRQRVGKGRADLVPRPARPAGGALQFPGGSQPGLPGGGRSLWLWQPGAAGRAARLGRRRYRRHPSRKARLLGAAAHDLDRAEGSYE